MADLPAGAAPQAIRQELQADRAARHLRARRPGPDAPGSDGAFVVLVGVVDQDDVRSSKVVAASGILPPGVYSFEAGLVADAGFNANPAPEYGDRVGEFTEASTGNREAGPRGA